MEIAIGCDHAGYKLKDEIVKYLIKSEFTIKDFGTFSDDSVDYPDFVHPVADYVSVHKIFGILICGSANGVAMTANKHSGIRAAICWNREVSELARKHNNANIICLPARFIDSKQATGFVDAFLNSTFEGGRHERRVKKIPVSKVSQQPD